MTLCLLIGIGISMLSVMNGEAPEDFLSPPISTIVLKSPYKWVSIFGASS